MAELAREPFRCDLRGGPVPAVLGTYGIEGRMEGLDVGTGDAVEEEAL